MFANRLRHSLISAATCMHMVNNLIHLLCLAGVLLACESRMQDEVHCRLAVIHLNLLLYLSWFFTSMGNENKGWDQCMRMVTVLIGLPFLPCETRVHKSVRCRHAVT